MQSPGECFRKPAARGAPPRSNVVFLFFLGQQKNVFWDKFRDKNIFLKLGQKTVICTKKFFFKQKIVPEKKNLQYVVCRRPRPCVRRKTSKQRSRSREVATEIASEHADPRKRKHARSQCKPRRYHSTAAGLGLFNLIQFKPQKNRTQFNSIQNHRKLCPIQFNSIHNNSIRFNS